MPCNVMNDKLWPYNTFQSGNINKKNKNKYIKNVFTLCGVFFKAVAFLCLYWADPSFITWHGSWSLLWSIIFNIWNIWSITICFWNMNMCIHATMWAPAEIFLKRWQLHHWSRLLTAAVACSLDLADAADVLKMQNDAIHFCRPVDFQLKQETSEASPQAVVF